jgi:fructosamine-3-kinase
VPRPLAVGATADAAYLALEWIEFGPTRPQSESALGEQLAWQHRVQAEKHGWIRDNTIGSTPQVNTWSADWPAFFRDRRLRMQLELAARNGHGGALQTRGARLLECVHAFFTSYRPVPSLLHGDLWGGNWGTDRAGAPVIFDPAVYYGDRETDIAMTRLFGGFSNRFYTAYQATWPLDQAAGTRRPLYNLYHVLNHLNLFGGAYRAQAEEMIGRLLAELGG